MTEYPYSGANEIAEGMFAPTIWTSLHTNAELWLRAGFSADTITQRASIQENDGAILRVLSTFPAAKWSAMCEAVGWTVYGAVGLSWCEGVTFSEVVAAWKETGLKINPTPEMRRPARMVNPAILPESDSLRETVIAVESDMLSVAIVMAARREPVALDIPNNALASAHPMIANFLLSDYGTLLSQEQEPLKIEWQKKVETAAER